jgi:hypothetical protein
MNIATCVKAVGRLAFAGPVLVSALSCGDSAQTRSAASPRAQVSTPAVGIPATRPADVGAADGGAEIEEQVAEAKRLADDGRYGGALAAIEAILARDPQNRHATNARQFVADKFAVREARRAAGGEPAATRPAAAAATRPTVAALLNRKFPEIRFRQATLAQAVEQLRERTGADFVVDWKALDAAGIGRGAPVDLVLYNVKLAKTLNILLDTQATPTSRLGYEADEGAIRITTAAAMAAGNVLTRAYDIRDLLARAPDADSAADGGGASATRPAGRAPGKTRAELAGEILTLVRETVAPDSWREAGGDVGSIKYEAGQLVVTQTPESHAELVGLLGQLREQPGR